MAQQPRGILAARNAAGRTREHAAGRQPHRFRNGRNAAMRLDDQQWRAQPRLAQPRLETREIALEHRPDIGVDDGRADPIVLLDLRQDLRRERHIDARHGGSQGFSGCALMGGIAPAVQVADRDGFDALALQDRDGNLERAAIEGDLDLAIGPHTLANAEPALAGHQLHRRRLAQIVAIVLEPLAHLDDVAMPLGLVSRPTLAPLCSSKALVATVVPCTIHSVRANIAARSTASPSASRSRPP